VVVVDTRVDNRNLDAFAKDALGMLSIDTRHAVDRIIGSFKAIDKM